MPPDAQPQSPENNVESDRGAMHAHISPVRAIGVPHSHKKAATPDLGTNRYVIKVEYGKRISDTRVLHCSGSHPLLE